jgi:predicted  nucleic acid-binding Zn-ribbon protein
MPGLTDLFRDIHRLRRFAHDLQEQIQRVPRQLQVQQARIARQEDLLRQGQDAIKHLKVSIHEKEVSLKTTHQQVAKHERQLNESASKKEYDALKAEIAADRQKCLQLEDEILGVGERLESLQGQLAGAQAQLQEAEVRIPPDVRLQYNRAVGAMGAEALAAVQNRNCSACYTAITAQHYNELWMGMFVVCRSCGRILYLPEAPPDSNP